MIQVAVLASNLALRAGLRALVGGDEEMEVVAEGASLDDFAGELPPDLDVLVGLAEAFAGGEELVSFLSALNSPPAILLLAEEGRAAQGLATLPLRAWGLLPLDCSEEELLAAVRALHEGLLVAAAPLLQPLLGQPLANGEDLDYVVEELTPRESEVLQLLAQGLANKQIALELDISEHTVKFHISSIYTKLGATSRTEAVRIGARLGLIVF